MSPERLDHIQTLYTDAASLQPQDRRAFLDGACGADSDLRKEIESLLAFQPRAETYLDKPAFEVAARSLADDERVVAGPALPDRPRARHLADSP